MLAPYRLATCLLTAGLFCNIANAQVTSEAAVAAPALLPLLMRWTHILAAITMLGGTIFMRFLVHPTTVNALDLEAAKGFRSALLGRWRKFIPWLILAFFVSGFYNYLAVTRHLHPNTPAYHMLFGIKFMLSLGLFALASLLTSPRTYTAKMRANAPAWLLLVLALGVAIVLIAGYMKLMP